MLLLFFMPKVYTFYLGLNLVLDRRKITDSPVIDWISAFYQGCISASSEFAQKAMERTTEKQVRPEARKVRGKQFGEQ